MAGKERWEWNSDIRRTERPSYTREIPAPFWERGDPAAVITMRECWFCKWSDFREDLTTHKSESFCRNPANRKRERETV